MFSLRNFKGVSFIPVDPESERDPPAFPTSISFPQYQAHRSCNWTSIAIPDLQRLFASISRPIDVSQRHIDALNIDIDADACNINDLLPPLLDRCSDLSPLRTKLEESFAADGDVKPASDGVSRTRNDFAIRVAELQIDNPTAYRVLARSAPRNGEKLPRIAHMRKFYEGLEEMSQYWDCSLDQYYEIPPPADVTKNDVARKRQRLAPDNGVVEKPANTAQCAAGEEEINAPTSVDDSVQHDNGENSHTMSMNEDLAQQNHSPSFPPAPLPLLRYKGLRTGCGKDMPDRFRFETMCGFLEAVIFPFRCCVAPPRHIPLVQVKNLNIPVRQSAMVHRVPEDRQRAREAYIEGPVLGLQVRSELEFGAGDNKRREQRALLDQVRVIGGLLQLAQERRREGRTEQRSGEGKWWTTKSRWGGGPGGEIEAQTTKEDENASILHLAQSALGTRQQRGSGTASRPPRKKTPALLWKELKPGSPLWDDRTDYMAIGKDPGSSWDQVFMISSLNTHVSVVKLTVHNAYLDFLATGELPPDEDIEPSWCCPRLQRTAWFDLFKVDERVQAFEAIWGLMCYLTREPSAAKQPGLVNDAGNIQSQVQSVTMKER